MTALQAASGSNAAVFVAPRPDRCCRRLLACVRPLRSSIDYRPLSDGIAIDDERAILELVTALRLIHNQSRQSSDLAKQFEIIRLTLLLARPFQRGGLLTQAGLGDFIEDCGLTMAYQSRQGLTREERLIITELLQQSSAREESLAVIAQRTTDWLLIVRGWRERVVRACRPTTTFASSFETWQLRSAEQEKRAMRATLICELALHEYLLDHGNDPPATLDELVPKYLSAIPLDPFSAKSLLYYQGDGTIPILVYSVGPNELSDGGRSALAGDDISIAAHARESNPMPEL